MEKLKVIRCKETQGGRYILKMEGLSKSASTGFIVKEPRKRTYYCSADEPVEVGTEDLIDMSVFDIKQFPYTFTEEDENGEEVEVTAQLTWLCSKRE